MGELKTLTVNGKTYKVVSTVPAASVTLLASAWVGSGTSYSQVVEVPGVTPFTKVDLQPTPEQLAEFHYKTLAFVTENDGGIVTVYSIGDKPDSNHTIQVTMTAVESGGKIRGNTVGTTMPIPDWNQTDPTQADYIKNKEAVNDHLANMNNPHEVTPAQIGAATVSYVNARTLIAKDPGNDGNVVLEYGAVDDDDAGNGGNGGNGGSGGLTAEEVQAMIDAALAAEDELTEEEVQAMIDASLGVIANGSY